MPNLFNYPDAINWLQQRGKALYGESFTIQKEDHEIITKLLCYFLKDEATAHKHKIIFTKGILFTGPIGVGKSALMNLMRFYQPADNRFIIRSCRELSFEFIRDGYEVIHKYSYRSFQNHEPLVYCFDDLGTENNLKLYGNECNVMAEILLSRYDLFVSRKLVTHLTTNLSASEIENFYGSRVRSRMREQFNLIAFDKTTKDKRK